MKERHLPWKGAAERSRQLKRQRTRRLLAVALGTIMAATMTMALIGPLPWWPIVGGTLFGIVYLGFAVAVVALVAGFTRSQATTVFGALGMLLVLPIVSIVDRVEPWLPSTLVGAVGSMVDGAPASDFAPALAVTLVTTVALISLAMRRLDRHEL